MEAIQRDLGLARVTKKIPIDYPCIVPVYRAKTKIKPALLTLPPCIHGRDRGNQWVFSRFSDFWFDFCCSTDRFVPVDEPFCPGTGPFRPGTEPFRPGHVPDTFRTRSEHVPNTLRTRSEHVPNTLSACPSSFRAQPLHQRALISSAAEWGQPSCGVCGPSWGSRARQVISCPVGARA